MKTIKLVITITLLICCWSFSKAQITLRTPNNSPVYGEIYAEMSSKEIHGVAAPILHLFRANRACFLPTVMAQDG